MCIKPIFIVSFLSITLNYSGHFVIPHKCSLCRSFLFLNIGQLLIMDISQFSTTVHDIKVSLH